MIMKNLTAKVCNKIIRHTEWYDRYWGGVQKFWYLDRFNLDVVNLGSNSGKYAFKYDGLEVAGMNWAVGPQSLLHDFNVLKNYFSYLRTGAFVIVTLCPFSSLVSHYDKEANLKYYTFLHPATILNFDENERMRALKIKQNPMKEMPWICLRGTLKEVIKSIIYKPVRKCDMGKDGVTFIDSWKKQFGIMDLDAPLTDRHRKDQENRIQVLKDLIEFCIERELKPVLAIPPVHPSLGKKMSKMFRENYVHSFVRRANEHNIPFMDYMDDKRFCEDKYFHNSFLMSEEGARKFTKIVMEDLKNM